MTTAYPAEPTRYLDRLAQRMARVQTTLCLGIDPDLDGLPAGFPRTVDGVGPVQRADPRRGRAVRGRGQGQRRVLRAMG